MKRLMNRTVLAGVLGAVVALGCGKSDPPPPTAPSASASAKSQADKGKKPPREPREDRGAQRKPNVRATQDVVALMIQSSTRLPGSTPEQRTKLAALRREAAPFGSSDEVTKLKTALFSDLAKAVEAGTVDAKAFEEQVKKVGEAIAAKDATRAKVLGELHALLTAEQRAAAVKLARERTERDAARIRRALERASGGAAPSPSSSAAASSSAPAESAAPAAASASASGAAPAGSGAPAKLMPTELAPIWRPYQAVLASLQLTPEQKTKLAAVVIPTLPDVPATPEAILDAQAKQREALFEAFVGEKLDPAKLDLSMGYEATEAWTRARVVAIGELAALLDEGQRKRLGAFLVRDPMHGRGGLRKAREDADKDGEDEKDDEDEKEEEQDRPGAAPAKDGDPAADSDSP